MVKSAYIHIPFCNTICSYCDFCKMYYIKKWIFPYLNALKKEIETHYHNEILDTIYIGGGTPSALDIEELTYLLETLKIFSTSSHLEYTIECNLESITKEKLVLFQKYGINRISIGIETVNSKLLKKIGRNHTKEEVKEKINWMKELGFSNINVDLMYALPEETLEDLKNDLDFFLSLEVPHISTYSLMIEPNTIFGKEQLKPISEELDARMYQEIKQILKKHHYIHYETSNFGKEGYFSSHNLTYWNNLEYYGFGLGASGYVDNIRYENTRSLKNYENGNYILESHEVSVLEDMQNMMILGLRKMEGVKELDFQKKYGKKIEEVFPIETLLQEKKLRRENGFLKIDSKYDYLANEILIYFI